MLPTANPDTRHPIITIKIIAPIIIELLMMIQYISVHIRQGLL